MSGPRVNKDNLVVWWWCVCVRAPMRTFTLSRRVNQIELNMLVIEPLNQAPLSARAGRWHLRARRQPVAQVNEPGGAQISIEWRD